MASRGKAARAKGIVFERWLAQRLRHIFPGARRHLENHTLDAKGFDLDGTEQYLFQCKKLKKYVSINTINEIQCDRMLGDVPILVTAGDDEPPMAVMYLEDFIRMLELTRDPESLNRMQEEYFKE